MKSMAMRKWMFMALMAAGLCCAAAGCSKKDTVGKDTTEEVQDSAAEQTTGQEGTGQKNGDGSGAGADEASDSDEAAGVSAEQSEHAAAGDGSTVKVEENRSGTGTSEEKPIPDSGYVKEVHDQYFTLSLIHNEVIDGGMVAVYSSEAEEVVEIGYTAETVFKILEVKNAGKNPEHDVTEKAASVNELKPDDMVMLEGGWDGEDYKAEVVYIYHFM